MYKIKFNYFKNLVSIKKSYLKCPVCESNIVRKMSKVTIFVIFIHSLWKPLVALFESFPLPIRASFWCLNALRLQQKCDLTSLCYGLQSRAQISVSVLCVLWTPFCVQPQSGRTFC